MHEQLHQLTRRQLAGERHLDRMPRSSPNGDEIVFFSSRSGRFEGWLIASDGSRRAPGRALDL